MKVVTGTKAPNGQLIEVELDEADGYKQFPEWEFFSIAQRFKKLAAYADILLVDYLFRGGIIGDHERIERLKKLNQELQ